MTISTAEIFLPLEMVGEKTRSKVQTKRERERKRYEMKKTDPKQRAKYRNSARQRNRRVKIEKQLLNDEILYWREKARKWKERCKRLEETKCDDVYENHQFDEDLQHQYDDLEIISEEQENDENSETPNRFEIVEFYLSKSVNLKAMIRMSEEKFLELAVQVQPAFDALTWRGTPRQRKRPNKQPFDIKIGLFITLFWMSHYPTLSLLGVLFNLHTKTITRIIKRTTRALKKTLEKEIQWPSNAELESQTYSFLQNDGFYDAVCIVDGTEIKISRPSDAHLQTKTWSGKKKQNSLNVMFITNLHGEILYYSPMRIGAHDQSHWNELGLRQMFLNKEYGILGDGGFTFNRKKDAIEIRGYKPHKKPKGGDITQEQKDWNRRLSQMRVVVETSIHYVKKWKVLGGIY